METQQERLESMWELETLKLLLPEFEAGDLKLYKRSEGVQQSSTAQFHGKKKKKTIYIR